MEIIYYIFTIVAIVWEITVLQKTEKYLNFKNSFFEKMEKKGKQPTLTDKEKTFVLLQFLYLCWVLVGLFSSQYMFFIIILVISIIPKKKVWTLGLDSIITLLILFGIILNKYHF